MRQRKHYTAEQKIIILRELLENNVPISQLYKEYDLRANIIYKCPVGMPSAEKEIV